MLGFLEHRPPGGDALIASTWAIGYAHYRQIIRHAGRLLPPQGISAFSVNYADTLSPVFQAFNRCMHRHPEQVRLALWPDFPKDWDDLDKPLRDAGFRILFHEDGSQPVEAPPEAGTRFDWLLHTGVLAGFDAVLPLHEANPASAFLRDEINAITEPLAHHYASVVAVKP